MITSEINVQDNMQRTLGGKEYNANEAANMIVDQKSGKVQWFDNDGNLIGEFGVLDGRLRFGMRVLDDEDYNRFFLGRNDNDYGYRMSKPQTDVFDENNASLLISDEVSYFQTQFNTFLGGQSATGPDPTGLVAYTNTIRNNILRLPFYKPDDVFLTEVHLFVQFFSSYSVTFGETKLSNASILLNPTRAIESSYDRYSGGNTLLNSYTAIIDGDNQEVHFTEAQINAIKSGNNEIIVQQQISDSGPSAYGLAVLSLVLIGYKRHY